jgi:hypothetical protein
MRFQSPYEYLEVWLMSDLFAFNLFFELGVLHLQVTFHDVKDDVA